MHYHIILTERCNMRCRYCYQKSLEEFDNGLEKKFKFDFLEPESSEVKMEELKSFLEKDENPFLIFYGGEPVLEYKKIMKIIDSLEGTNVKYRMQTNGILLDMVPKEYLKKIGKILISIDGDKERTDFNRGEGTYNKVLENISKARSQGYVGELVARMTVAQEFPDIFEQVIYLINAGFDSVHWQIDAGFYSNDFEREKISNFFKKYLDSLEKLIDWWVSEIRKGIVHKIYPLIGIVEPILSKRTCGLRCGAGESGYAISTSGKIVFCPIMNNIEDFKAGDLSSNPNELKKMNCKTECKECEVYDLCGGRCMYWRKTNLWPKEGDEMICNSVKLHIKLIQEKIPEIKELINKRIISKEDFNYEEFFGPEIIP